MSKQKINVKEIADNLNSVKVQIRAQHLNFANGNALWYKDSAARKGGKTWLTPYGKPQLVHHDKVQDAVGRVLNYKVITESTEIIDNEPMDFVLLDVDITDRDAIYKVLSGIYLTCSVGSSTTKARCSVCNQVITEDGLCEHERGSYTKDNKLIYWIIDELSYKENSFVNVPADPFARIVMIDFGTGYVPYSDFLNNKESLLSSLTDLEDSMFKSKLLTKEDRQNLPESTFCGPDRTFPAHDKEHVESSIALLKSEACKFEDSVKNKILASLYRKGARFDVIPSEDESKLLEDLVFRMEDNFNGDETSAIVSFFDSNPNADLPKEDVVPASTEPAKVEDEKEKTDAEKLADLQKLYDDLKSSSDSKISEQVTKIEDLTTQLTDVNSLLIAKEDEINNLMDKLTVAIKGHKDSLIDTIILAKLGRDAEDSEVSNLREKYNSRKIDSLIDTINDLRVDVTTDSQPITKVDDPTVQIENIVNDDQKSNTDKKVEDLNDQKFSIFFEQRK